MTSSKMTFLQEGSIQLSLCNTRNKTSAEKCGNRRFGRLDQTLDSWTSLQWYVCAE